VYLRMPYPGVVAPPRSGRSAHSPRVHEPQVPSSSGSAGSLRAARKKAASYKWSMSGPNVRVGSSAAASCTLARTGCALVADGAAIPAPNVPSEATVDVAVMASSADQPQEHEVVGRLARDWALA
jgi:hypothetical protein